MRDSPSPASSPYSDYSDLENCSIKPKSIKTPETEIELNRRVERQIREIRGHKASNWSSHNALSPINVVVGSGLRFSKDTFELELQLDFSTPSAISFDQEDILLVHLCSEHDELVQPH